MEQDKFEEKLQRVIRWLIKQGYAVECEVDGDPGIKLTESGRKYYEEHKHETP